MKVIKMGSKPKSVRKLIKHAKMGNPKAMYELGLMFEQNRFGEGETNPFEAAYWISCAADLGYKPAEDWLQNHCIEGTAE